METRLKPIRVGDRVVVQGYPVSVWVSRIYRVDRYGAETLLLEATAKIMLELDWGELGKSKVALEDENKIWYRYCETN